VKGERIGLQEYDIEIKSVHTIKDHSLFELAAKAVNAKEDEEELSRWEQEIEMYNVERTSLATNTNSWYMDVR